MRITGPLKSSANAGELSRELYAKVGLKQYYSGASRMANFEPVPQAGFRLGPGSVFVATARSDNCRLLCLPVRPNLSFMIVLTDGKADIYNADTRVLVDTISSARIQATRLAEYEFYAEGNTVGIFHEDDDEGIRIFRVADDDWTLDDWPYESLPVADLGGSYPETSDRWEIYLRYTPATSKLVIQLTVDGQQSDTVPFVSATTGDMITPDGSVATDDDYELFAENITDALAAMPGLDIDGAAVVCTYIADATADQYRVLRVDFGGTLSGSAYEFDCQVVNTSDASTLVGHVRTGDTELEDLISDARGGFAGMTLFQDRAVYFAPKAERAALAMSDVGEYFRLDITKTGDQYARLERLRSQTSQKIYAVVEDTYLLVFTNAAEWFLTNRVIKQSEPLNFVVASEIGTKKGVRPVKFDGRMWFVSRDGSSLHSIQYDAVGENYQPKQEDLLATHLVTRIRRMVVQRKVDGAPTPRLWLLRGDGRLVMAVAIEAQEIAAFSEWVAAGEGTIMDICPDGDDRMWLVIKRGSAVTLEMMQEADTALFQCSISGVSDLTGVVAGLGQLNGRTVWARIDGYVDGPYTVAGGQIATEHYGKPASVGLWQPPVLTSMPMWKLLPNEELLKRPARVHSLSLQLLHSESVAVGANRQGAKNVPLNRMADDLSMAPPVFTGVVEVAGLTGFAQGPTVTITQTRPGLLTVRDYVPGVKF